MLLLKRSFVEVCSQTSGDSPTRFRCAWWISLPRWRRYLAPLLLVSSPTAATAQFNSSDFQLVASHGLAIQQPTTQGRTFWALHSYQGNLYTGYGDWNTNTGPISISHWSPTREEWTHEIFFATESIELYRDIGGTLYVPNIDPTGSRGGLAFNTFGPTGNMWSERNSTSATHVFDVATLDGTDLWMTGSLGDSAIVWRGTVERQRWQIVREDLPASGSFSRYYGAGVLDGKFYVQRRDVEGARVTSSLVYDGVNWFDGPDLLSSGGVYVWKPQVFGDVLVYLSQSNSFGNGGLLYRFDGVAAEQTYAPFTAQAPFGSPLDYVIADNKLFTLTSRREIITTTDLENWELLGYAPSNSYSLAVLGNSIYVGTNNSEILSVQFIPEPASIILFLCAVATMATHRDRHHTLAVRLRTLTESAHLR